jgi:hypothetical protein
MVVDSLVRPERHAKMMSERVRQERNRHVGFALADPSRRCHQLDSVVV